MTHTQLLLIVWVLPSLLMLIFLGIPIIITLHNKGGLGGRLDNIILTFIIGIIPILGIVTLLVCFFGMFGDELREFYKDQFSKLNIFQTYQKRDKTIKSRT